MKKHYFIALAIIIATLLAIFWFKVLPSRVPFNQCSTIYRHYADQPGIEASFLKHFRIDDSTFSDVTILHALDSNSWQHLLTDFQIPVQPQSVYDRISQGEEVNLLKLISEPLPENGMDTCISNNALVVISLKAKNISLYHFHSKETMKIIFSQKLLETSNSPS